MNQPTQQSNLELLPSVTFAAGETKLFFVSGSYFELIDCASPVDVLLTDRSGGQRARMIGAAQTHHVKKTPYEAIQITSATAQAIRFAYGSGEAGTRNTAGSVNISNTSGAFANSQKTVGTSSATMVAANAARRYLMIQNNDALIDIWVRLDGAAAAVNGSGSIKIPANGTYELQGYVPNGAITAVAASANANVAVVEG